jgi:hypothetical protein
VLSVALLADEAITDFPAMAAGVRAGFETYLSRAGVTPQPAAAVGSHTVGPHTRPAPEGGSWTPGNFDSLVLQADGQTSGR